MQAFGLATFCSGALVLRLSIVETLLSLTFCRGDVVSDVELCGDIVFEILSQVSYCFCVFVGDSVT